MQYNGFVHGIKMQVHIGLYELERHKPQELVMDVDYQITSSTIADSDDIDDTVNYQTMIYHLKNAAEKSQFKLVETLGAYLLKEVELNFNVNWIKIKLAKTSAIKYASCCGVVVERNYASN